MPALIIARLESAKHSSAEFRLEPIVGVIEVFDLFEPFEVFLGNVSLRCSLTHGRVLREIEFASIVESKFGEVVRESPESFSISFGDLKIESHRESVDAVCHEERVRFVFLENTEEWRHPCLLRSLEDFRVRFCRVFLGDKRLELNESAFSVGEFPVRHIVE